MIARFFLPLLIVILAAISFSFSRQETVVLPPLPEPVSGIFGVLEVVNDAARTVTMTLPDGGQEEIVVPFPIELTVKEEGLLARVSGTRDPSTRKITAETIEIIREPNLFVTSPEVGATVTSPLVVFGFGRTFEQTFQWRVRDVNKKIVASGFGTSYATDVGRFGPFRFEVFLPAMTDPSFTLEVFWKSPANGREQDIVFIPLKLLNTETVSYNVFFGNGRQGSNEDCEQVFPSSRTIAKTSAVARAALLDLLAGPTPEEWRQGFFTSLPESAGLNSLVVGQSITTADFDAGLERGIGGSCRVTAIREQIRMTLSQFPTVGDVLISIDGRTEDILQP